MSDAAALHAACSRVALALAEVPPAGPAAYVAAAYEALGGLVGSREGTVYLASRAADDPADPLRGFRLRQLWLIGQHNTSDTRITDLVMQDPDILLHDPQVRRMALEVGKHRVYHPDDPREQGGLDGWIWEGLGLVDELKLLHMLDERHELCVCFYRGRGESRFGERDRELLETMNPLLRPWARRVALLLGELPGQDPLSPRESEVLVELLQSDAQKLFGDRLGLSAARVNELVRAVHRKLRTGNRAELQRAWMSEAGAPKPGLASTVHRPRATRD